MERLTHYREKDHAVCVTGLTGNNYAEKLQDVADRLAAYEDTGLTPEEIISLKNRAHEYSFAFSEARWEQDERDRYERGIYGVYG